MGAPARGEAAAGTRRPATAAALARTRAALFAEHLQPWLPAYLDAVTDLETPGLTAWAQLTRHAMSAESGSQPPPAQLPLALREAPAPAGPDGRVGDLTAALTTPVRSGIILTRRRLAHGAAAAGVGHRIGERRYTLRAMLEQDPAATLDWLGHEAQRWEQQHASRGPGDAISRWWTARAAGTARFLRESAAAAGRHASQGIQMSSCQGPGNGTAAREAGTVTPAPRRSPHQPTPPAWSALIIVPGQVTVRPADGTVEVLELGS